jgi:hypothetical protein
VPVGPISSLDSISSISWPCVNKNEDRSPPGRIKLILAWMELSRYVWTKRWYTELDLAWYIITVGFMLWGCSLIHHRKALIIDGKNPIGGQPSGQ